MSLNASDSQTFIKVKRRIKEHGQLEQIDQLCLDQIKITNFSRQLSALVEKCRNVEHLSLTDCQLTHLCNFPSLNKLKILNLSNNKLTQNEVGSLRIQIKQRVKKMNLSKNWLRSIEPLKDYKGLQQLQIEDNPVSLIDQNSMSNESYHLQLFTTLPNLRLVNRINRQGNQQLNQFNNQFQDYENQENQNNQNSENDNQQGQQSQDSSSNNQQDYQHSQPNSHKSSSQNQNSMQQKQQSEHFQGQYPKKIKKQQ